MIAGRSGGSESCWTRGSMGCRDVEYHGAPAVEIDYRTISGHIQTQRRENNGKGAPGRRFAWKHKGHHPIPWGLEELSDSPQLDEAVLCEGVTDGLTLRYHQFSVCALPGTRASRLRRTAS